MTTDKLYNEIKDELLDRDKEVSDKALREYHGICSRFSISASALADQIEAETLRNPLSDPSQESFIQDIQKHFKKSKTSQIKKKTQQKTQRKNTRNTRKKGTASSSVAASSHTSTDASVPPPALDDLPAFDGSSHQLQQSFEAYRERKNRGTLEESFGATLTHQQTPAQDLKLKVLHSTHDEKIRYMYDNMNQKSDLLADRVLEIGEALKSVVEADTLKEQQKEESIANEDKMQDEGDEDSTPKAEQAQNAEPLEIEYQNFGIVTGGEALYLGRVLCESITGLSKLNLNSVLLEGFSDDEHNKSMIYKLDLTSYANKHNISLFPGQVIAVQGLLSVRGVLSATKIYTNVSMRPRPLQFEASGGSKRLNVMIARGPFTPSSNISYEPFSDLMQVVRQKQPDLLVLLGPFVDSDQKLINSPELNETYDDLFAKHVIQPLQNSLSQKTRALLIPSLQDAHHDFVYPQPEFDRRMHSITSNQIECLTNPSLFTLEGFGNMTMGASSHHVLSQLQSLQYCSKAPKDLSQQVATHLVEQHSFYPIMMNTSRVPLDYSLSRKKLDWNGETPHVLVVSHREAFARFLPNGTLVVCPRALTRSNTGGTYVELDISLGEKDAELKEDNISVRVVNI